ncbi:MAG TPA: hypothetical protein VFP98_06260 [Candidatus Polarisedimenticolia bacterium]|nr:hypothetical protein [Candidatus Polarisedimenticolia bacterium]
MFRTSRRALQSGLPRTTDESHSHAPQPVTALQTGTNTTVLPRSLETLRGEVSGLEDGVRRADLHLGDWVLVRTKNSSYSMVVLGDGRYRVSGGWFDKEGISPATVTITGCTFGGRAIATDVVAGRDLCLEFGNNVVTTRIRSVRVIRSDMSQVH